MTKKLEWFSNVRKCKQVLAEAVQEFKKSSIIRYTPGAVPVFSPTVVTNYYLPFVGKNDKMLESVIHLVIKQKENAMQVVYPFFVTIVIISLVRMICRKVLDLPGYSGALFSDSVDVSNLMPENKFWTIIQQVRRKSKGHYLTQCELLTEYLSTLHSEEIIQFDRTFGLLMAKSYSFRLWEPVYALNGGCSDDGFEHFRSWLIAQGRNKFYWTIQYPRILFLIGVKEFMENYEGIAYCAYTAYQAKTGEDLPQRSDIEYASGGKLFKEGQAFFRYPELALLAW